MKRRESSRNLNKKEKMETRREDNHRITLDQELESVTKVHPEKEDTAEGKPCQQHLPHHIGKA